MQEYDNNFTGILSRNDRKEEDWHADFRGSCEIDGVEYWIDAFTRVRNDGSGKFLSLRFRDKSAPRPQGKGADRRSQSDAKPARGRTRDDLDDDIPF